MTTVVGQYAGFGSTFRADRHRRLRLGRVVAADHDMTRIPGDRPQFRAFRAIAWAYEQEVEDNPAKLVEDRFTPTDKFILVTLASRCNSQGKTTDGQSSLIADTGYNARTVSRSLKKLQLLGYVKAEPRFDVKGKQLADEISLLAGDRFEELKRATMKGSKTQNTAGSAPSPRGGFNGKGWSAIQGGAVDSPAGGDFRSSHIDIQNTKNNKNQVVTVLLDDELPGEPALEPTSGATSDAAEDASQAQNSRRGEGSIKYGDDNAAEPQQGGVTEADWRWWLELIGILRQRIERQHLRSFVETLTLQQVEADALTLAAPSAFVRDRVDRDFRAVIERAAARRVILTIAVSGKGSGDTQRVSPDLIAAGRMSLPPGDRE